MLIYNFFSELNPLMYPIFAYLLGSIPFGLILSEMFGKGNLRQSGSGNIGATNVWRTQGRLLSAVTFLLDFGKGCLACYFFQSGDELINCAVIAAPIIGHMFPIWLKFSGGKGIATYFGTLCALNIYVFFASILVWLMMFFVTKISSISGLTSIIFSCIAFFFAAHQYEPDLLNKLGILIILVVIIILKHHDNIKRLINKTELKT